MIYENNIPKVERKPNYDFANIWEVRSIIVNR
jgi:hypothetical protein